MYDTKEEANQKLGSTIVLYKSTPVYITEADGKGKDLTLYFKNLRTNTGDKASIFDKNFNFRNLGEKLGYFNLDTGKGSYRESVYVQRAGVRQSHSTQGLSQKNLRFSKLRGNPVLSLGPAGCQFALAYTNPGFLDMLEEKYPDLKAVESSFNKKDGWVSMAFNPKYSIRSDSVGPFYIQYRGKDIGFSSDFYKWKIADQFKHLYEHLEYLNVRIA